MREATTESAGCVLIVDDQPDVRRTCERILRKANYQVRSAGTAEEALADYLANEASVDVIVSDVCMPGMDGLALLRTLREHGSEVPVILLTGSVSISGAMLAVEHGAARYAAKPFHRLDMLANVADAIAVHRRSRARRRHEGEITARIGDLRTLEARFDAALATLWMAFQPIVDGEREIFGYEALMRAREPSLPHPGAVVEAALHLGRGPDLLHAVIAKVAAAIPSARPSASFFINITPADLLDEQLYSPECPLAPYASRVVIELTERESCERVTDLCARLHRLRAMGYRIAVDDLGAGYAGLASLVQLEPEVVKIDMSLVRDVDSNSTKRCLVEALRAVCAEGHRTVVAEGVETIEELATLRAIGCDLYQGYLLARPGAAFPTVTAAPTQ